LLSLLLSERSEGVRKGEDFPPVRAPLPHALYPIADVNGGGVLGGRGGGGWGGTGGWGGVGGGAVGGRKVPRGVGRSPLVHMGNASKKNFLG